MSPITIKSWVCHTVIIKNPTPQNIDTVYDKYFVLQSTVSIFKAQLEAFSKCERLTESKHRSQISIQALLNPEIESNAETEILSVEGIIESLPPGDTPQGPEDAAQDDCKE